MSAEPASPPRGLAAQVSRSAPALAPVAGTALLITGIAGQLPVLPAVCAAILLSALVHTALLARVALLARDRDAALACLAVFVGGATAAGVALAGGAGAAAPALASSGLVIAALLCVTGTLLSPDGAPSPVARIRQALDGLCIGVSLLFTSWVLVIAPRGTGRGLVAVDVAAAALAVAVAGMTALSVDRYRVTAWARGAGSALAVLGLAGLALVPGGLAGLAMVPGGPAGPRSRVWLTVAGLCLVCGPALSWIAARRYATARAAGAIAADGTVASHPVMAAPILAVLIAALYHIVAVRSFDVISGCLACGVLAVFTAREAFAASDNRRYTRTVAAQEAHFRSLVCGCTDVTVVLDADLVIRWQSPAAASQFGLCDRDTLGRPLTALLHPEDVPAVRERLGAVLAGRVEDPVAGLLHARLRDGAGHWRQTESTVNDLRQVPEVGGLVVHLRDVGEHRAPQRTLHRCSLSDPLTGLANRQELLRGISSMRGLPGQPGGVLVVALDGLAGVRGVHGPEVGDQVLVEAARRLCAATGESDLAARLSDDEFAVATAGPGVQAYALATRLLARLHQPYQIPGALVRLTANVGVAELAPAASASDTLGRAELAVHRARQLGHGRIEWYDGVLEAVVIRRAALEQDLPGAVQRGELDVLYHPVLDLVEQRPVGVQALARWHHPRLGTVPASDFLPVAEDLNLIPEIVDWLVNQACRQLSAWLRDGYDLWLTANLVRHRLAANTLADIVRAALCAHHVPAGRLVVEVTESTLVAHNQPALDQLTAVRALGTRTALAHFGSGGMPCAQLRRLPIDVLKVDPVIFSQPGGRDGSTTPVMDAVVGLGRRLGLEIVAEGLEAAAHLPLVRAAGCRYGQGYVFGQPAPAEHFEAFLEGSRTPT